MKTQQKLQLHYWGPLYDMVNEYNAKHGCDVKPWECVKISGKNLFTGHPTFGDCDYTFALTILYDDKLKQHRPVFVGDKLWWSSSSSYQTAEDVETFKKARPPFWSWNPPTPKRTFKLNDLELPCPEKRNEGGFLTTICGNSFLFDTFHDCNDFKTKLMSLLTTARDEE